MKLVVLTALTSSATTLKILIVLTGSTIAANATGIQIKTAALLRELLKQHPAAKQRRMLCKQRRWPCLRPSLSQPRSPNRHWAAHHNLLRKGKRRWQISPHPLSKPQLELLLSLDFATPNTQCQVISAPSVSLLLFVTRSALIHAWQCHLLCR